MPYITPEDRARLDPMIEEIKRELVSKPVAGNLNYVVTRLMQAFVGDWKKCPYATHSAVCGAVRDAVDEYKDRAMRPYEDRKARQNGDVYDVGP